jgi:heptosyltransferase III
MKEILVIYVARLGDTLLVTPMMRHLKDLYPEAKLTFLGHKRSIDLVDHLPFLDHVRAMSKAKAPYLAWLQKRRYDLALVYGQDAALVRYAERLSHRVICFDQPHLVPAKRTTVVPKPSHLMHAVDERALLLSPLHTELEDKNLSYQVTEGEKSWAEEWVGDQGYQDRFLVAMKPQSFVDKNYRDWTMDSTIAFCKIFLAHQPRAHFLFLGTQEDQTQLAAAVQELGACATSLAGQFTLRQTAAIMNRSHFYLGVDTGLTHLAGALKLPMVALYHCRHRGRYLAPLHHDKCVVVEHPCSDDLCSASISMAEITPEQVLESVQKLGI